MVSSDASDPRRTLPDEVLRLAFAVWVSKLIADADGVLDHAEIRLLTRVFPHEVLQGHDLVDENGHFTETYYAAYKEAIRVLPGSLSTPQKLELITIFHHVCLADDSLVQAELLVLREAAEVLGIDVRQLSRHLATLKDTA